LNIEQFIEQRKTSWYKLSDLLRQAEQKGLKKFNKDNLLELGNLYRHASSDLSYAKTRFNDKTTIVYLNQLVARSHNQIYTPEIFRVKQIYDFYLKKFPELFLQTFYYILLAALIFIFSHVVSFFIVKIDPSAAYIFLGEEANQIEERLKNSHTEAQIPEGMAPTLSSEIMTNNISVGFKAFALGITIGIGTVYVLIFNGFMLGSLSALFNNYHYDLQFWALILPHGIIELLAIFICGGAGFLLADAILKPGDLTISDALNVNGHKAIGLVLGVIPMFIIAGIIEGFITPLDISPWIKIIFSFITAVLLGVYFLYGKLRSEK
jgi:uncharacterized membrane protein SpoIIM required for sporulation